MYYKYVLTLLCCYFSPVDVSVVLPVTLKMRFTRYFTIRAQDDVKYALIKRYFINLNILPTG